jgi:hypothetical protein
VEIEEIRGKEKGNIVTVIEKALADAWADRA